VSEFIFSAFESTKDGGVIGLLNLNSFTFTFVAVDSVLNFFLESSKGLIQNVFFIVEFVLERKKMLIERDLVAKECLVTRRFILLVHFAVFEHLDLRFHNANLLLKVLYIVDRVHGFGIGVLAFLGLALLGFSGALEVGVAFELFVGNGTRDRFGSVGEMSGLAWLSRYSHD